MRFSRVILACSLGATVFAAPAPNAEIEERQDNTAYALITTTVNSLKNIIDVDVAAIQNIVGTVQTTVGATTAIVAALTSNIQAIEQVILYSAGAVLNVTAAFGTGLVGGTLQVTQNQIDMLSKDLIIVTNIVQNLNVNVSLAIDNLSPAVQTLLQGELDNLQAVVPQLTDPITNFASILSTTIASAKLNYNIGGLTQAVTGLQGILADTVNSLGFPTSIVPSLAVPSLPSVPSLGAVLDALHIPVASIAPLPTLPPVSLPSLKLAIPTLPAFAVPTLPAFAIPTLPAIATPTVASVAAATTKASLLKSLFSAIHF